MAVGARGDGRERTGHRCLGVAVGAGWRRSGVLGSLRITGWPVAHDRWVGEWPLAHDHVWHGEGGRLRTTLYQGPVAMMLRLDLEGGRLRTIGAGLGVAVCARWRHVCRV